jgi:hypothetical protein
MREFLRTLKLTLVFVLGLIGILRAQTTVIVDPAGAGGFELGNSFAANGWTVANSANNPWIVAPLSNGLITGNAAFISDNGTTPNFTPANNSSNYFWRDVTIPAGETKIRLTFDWISNGENLWDLWQVFVAPTSITPVGSTTHPGNGLANVPTAIAGATFVGSGQLQTTVQSATFFLPASAAGTTVRLIFHWKNDSGGTQPPAQIDNISLTSTVPGNFISIITGDWNNPLTWDANAVPTPADNATVSATHTVTANATGQGINNLIVNGTLAYGATPTQFNVNGNLTVGSTGLVNVFATTTGKTLIVSGNIINDGRIDVSVGATTAGNLTLNGSTVQTVSGSGAFGGTNATTTTANTVGVIRNLTFSNTNTATPNIIWSIPSTIRIANNLNLTGARVNASGNTFTFGNFAVGGTLTSPAGTGFMSGTKFARWWTATATGTPITAGAEPTTVTSMYPFVSNAGQNRRAHIERSSSNSAGNTVGYLAVLFQNSTVLTQALSIDDAGYTVTDRFEANWTVTAEAGYVYASGTHEISLVGTGGFFPINGNSRVLLQNSSVGGAHQNGTTLPVAQRSGLSTTQLTAGALYMGVNTLDNVYPCTGTPTGGTTVSSATPACSGVNFTLSLTGNTSGPGITYQWQSSTNGVDWTNITGATLATRSVSQTAVTYYQCLVTCDGNTTPSTPIMINLDIPTNCYCIPTTTFGCTDGDVIARVVLNTLDNNSGTGCPSGTLGYSNYTTDPTLTTSLLPSTTYGCTVYAGQYGEGYAAWIDYNDDGVFDNATERIGFSNGQVAGSGQVGVLGSSATFPITLACTPPAGVHRLRVRAMFNTNGSAVTPCTNNSYGETEDYLITIVAPPTCPSPGTPVAGTATSFTLSFDFPLNCATATNYDIEYGPAGFTPGTGTIAANQPAVINGTTGTVTLTGLTPLTVYDAYIRSNCGAGDVSTWTLVTTGSTLQPPCSGTPNAPVVGFVGNTTICDGSNTVISASGMTDNVLQISNQWEVSTNNIDWNSIAGEVLPTYQSGALTAGTYYYRYTSTCLASNQTSTSNVVTLVVNAPPVVTITAPNNGTFCGTQTLTAAGAVSYVWSPATLLNTATGASVVYTGTTSGTLTATGTDANGCVASSAPFVVTFTTPDPITWVATTPSFCGTGGTTSVSVTSATNYTYSLVNNSTAVISGFTPTSFNTTVTETSAFLVTGTDPVSGCISQTPVQINVFPLPTANVTSDVNGVCPGTAANISTGLAAGNFTSASIPFAALTAPGNAVTLVSGGVINVTPDLSYGFDGDLDDAGWSAIPVGFNFNFFGTSYNTISIGTNGTVFFGTTPNVSDFTFTTLPSTTEPFNMVAVLAMDNNLATATGGSVKYWTEGLAPNRKFIVSYENVQEFGATETSTAQAIFYETIGTIEVHVTSSTNVDRNKLVGVNNGDGTVGVLAYASGTTASATNPIANPFAYRFSPPANYTTVWTATNTQGTTTIASGTNIFTQAVTPTETTVYSISYTNQTTGCSNPAGSADVTIAVLGNVAPTGVVASTPNSLVCPGVNFQVTSNYTGSLNGLTFQWQVSTNGVDYTNITGATTQTLTVSQTVNSEYRLQIVSCGGTPENTNSVAVAMDVPTNCYCTPVYTNGTTAGDLISNVEIVGTTLANNTGFVAGGPSYTFFTGQPNYTATLLPSSSYTLNVSTGEWGDQGYAAWIDYNDDGIFDATELVGATNGVIGAGLTTGQINASSSFVIALACTPPAGVHRMRIRGVYFQDGQTIQPCDSYSFGETEDYLVTVAPAPTCPSPGILAAGSSTSTSAGVNWGSGCSTATAFDFEYGPVGFTQGTGTLLQNETAANAYTIIGLTPNSTYEVYYRANCGSGEVSAWSVPVTVSTPCAPISLVNPGAQVVCNTYALPTLAEVTPSNNAGLTLSYRTATNGGGTVITGNITTTQTVHIYGVAGSCSANESFLVTVNNSSTSTTNVTQCSSYTWTNSVNYTASGTYTQTLANAAGCDSVATLNLVITQPTTSTLNQTACQTYTLNNQTYTTSGTYTQTLTNAAGCDSTITLNLTIGQPDAVSVTETACDSYTWNGTTYTTSGVYVETLTNALGCDSVVTLNLTINNTSSSNTVVSECASYLWNGTTYTASGTYTFTAQNAAGCDSTATLVLTIGNNSSTTTAATCGSFTWTNGTTYTASGTYTQTLTNAAGCDSLVTLNLTINPTPTATATDNGNGTGTLVASTGASYQWIDCATNTPITGATSATYVAPINGSYAVIVTNSSNCSATSSCVIVDYIGLEEITVSFNVYPNPTTGAINIAIDQTTANYDVTVEDMNGRAVANFGSLINGNGVYSLDLSNVVTGVYFIKLRNELEERTVRIIKQ